MFDDLTGPLSLADLLREREEMQKDFLSFTAAYDIVCKRIAASNEMTPPRHPLLHTWSGARAVCGAMELSINAIRRTLEEYSNLIRLVDVGEIENTDRKPPTLTVVKD